MTRRLEQYDVIAIPCDRIYFDDSFNCRGEFTLQSVQELANSIESAGMLLSPVWVQPAADVPSIPAGYDYRLLAGHRRFRAVTTYLKWADIPATVFAGLSEREARLRNLTENLERKDLNPLEEALAIRALYPNGVTTREAARELKRDVRWVHTRLRLLSMPDDVQQLVAARRVTLLDLEAIARRETPEEQIAAALAIAASKRGQGRKACVADSTLLRSFRRRRNKAEIDGLILRLLDSGIGGLAPRVAAWCAGRVTDEELEEDIQAERNRTDSRSYLE